jgi:hypothetical protein
MTTEVELKNLEKYLPELSHANSAVLGSTAVRHVVQCSCDTSVYAFSQNDETIVLFYAKTLYYSTSLQPMTGLSFFSLLPTRWQRGKQQDNDIITKDIELLVEL